MYTRNLKNISEWHSNRQKQSKANQSQSGSVTFFVASFTGFIQTEKKSVKIIASKKQFVSYKVVNVMYNYLTISFCLFVTLWRKYSNFLYEKSVGVVVVVNA